MADKPVFMYVATYDSVQDAQVDYDAIKDLYADGVIATYDAAIISKSGDGKVHVTKHEKPTQHGAWTGAAIGALVGLVFPPSIIAGAAIGAGAGALTGHLAKGMSRGDMKQIGDLLQANTASLVVLGESDLQQKLQQAVTHATQQYETQVQVDAQEFDQALDQVVTDLAASDTPDISPNA